jgi:hypothetical protein
MTDDLLIDRVARAIANTHHEVVWGEPLGERDFKVGIIAYQASARAALKIFQGGTLPDEVEHVARAMWHAEAERHADFPLSDWEKVEDYAKEDYRRLARAALTAMTESRQDLIEENDKFIGEINDVLTLLTRRGYPVDKDLSLVSNLRKHLPRKEVEKDDVHRTGP